MSYCSTRVQPTVGGTVPYSGSPGLYRKTKQNKQTNKNHEPNDLPNILHIQSLWYFPGLSDGGRWIPEDRETGKEVLGRSMCFSLQH